MKEFPYLVVVKVPQLVGRTDSSLVSEHGILVQYVSACSPREAMRGAFDGVRQLLEKGEVLQGDIELLQISEAPAERAVNQVKILKNARPQAEIEAARSTHKDLVY